MAFYVLVGFVCSLLLLPTSNTYFFEDDFNHHYTYSVDMNMFGEKNMTTVLKFHIRLLNTTDNGHRLHFLEVDSIVLFITKGLFQENPLNWNLSKHFLFETTDDGSIDLVHFHSEDEAELLIIKKALTSLFSVKVQLSDENEWSYNTTENDHFGEMNHEYTATKTTTGMTLKRHHYSTHEGHRRHEKVLHYDHRGTVHAATAYDDVVLKNTEPYKERQPLPGEYVHKINTSGDFPEIHMSAQVHVKLDAKIYHGKKLTMVEGLTSGILLTELKRPKKKLNDVSLNIQNFMECVHNISDITDANRSVCIENLRMILLSLNESEYRYQAETILNRTCDPRDLKCLAERSVYVDLVARAGDMTSQEIILDQVLNIPNPLIDDLRRVFVHCIVIMQPTKNFVQAIERFCFGEDNLLHGTTNLTLTQRRACLALGSLANNIAKYNTPLAEKIVEKIETWIQKHKEVNSTVREKRSVLLTELSNDEEDYILARSTLIHSLGNAALKRSLPHIIAHTHPNPVFTTWKQAAVAALRHYTCTESALALFDSALFDKSETVRKMASELYRKHPKGNTFTAAHKDIILRQRYNYLSMLRLKRSVSSENDDNIILNINLAFPFCDWKKQIGSRAIGASFGITFDNSLRALFRPLSGFVRVHVDDKLFATIHLGVIKKHFDILLIELCYKGKIEYNLNIFKDFSVNQAQDLASAFDQMTDKMMKPMVDSLNNVSIPLQDATTSERKAVFEPFSKAVKDIPNLTKSALDSALNLTRIVNTFSGFPWMTKFKETVESTQSLVEDINSDAMDFYNKIADASIIGLPYAENEISEAVNSALKLIGKVSESPQQSFQALEETRLKYQLGLARVLQSNKIIRETTSLLKGDKSSWMSVGGDIDDVITTLKNAHSKMEHQSRKRRFLSGFKKSFSYLGSSIEDGLTAVQKDVDSVATHLNKIKNHATKNFQKASDSRHLATETLLAGFEGFRDAVEKVKSSIHGLFGNKFYKTFPSHRMPCDSTCGCGYFPACKKYGTPGVNLITGKDKEIPCPVNSMVLKQEDNTLLLLPVGADLSEYEIIISNIKANFQPKGVFVKAGKIIGISAGKNYCKDYHIHVAMRKKESKYSDCFYLDPSPFLDSLKIIPVWIEECKEFKFKHLGQYFETGKLLEKFQTIITELVREGVKFASGLIMKEIRKLNILPDELKSLVSGFISNIGKKIQNEGNVGQLFSNISEHMEDFQDKINIGSEPFKNIVNMLGDQFPEIHYVTSKIDGIINNPQKEIVSFASGVLGKITTKFGLSKSGGKSALLSLIKASPSKLCPSFINGLARGFGHSCIAENDCMGIRCEIRIPIKGKYRSYRVGFHVDPQEQKTTLFAGDRSIDISGRRSNQMEFLDSDVLGYTVRMKLFIMYSYNQAVISATAITCNKWNCLQEIPILKNLRFDYHFNANHSTTQHNSRLSRMELLENTPMADITKLLFSFNQNDQVIVNLMNNMRDGIRSELSVPWKAGFDKPFDTELTSPVFVEANGKYPGKDNKAEISINILRLPLAYPIGPVVLGLEFSVGGAFGFETDIKVNSVTSSVKAVFSPWIAGKLQLELYVSVIIIKIALQLKAFIVKTKFPLSLEIAYGKLPVEEIKSLDVELIPIELKLCLSLKFLCLPHLSCLGSLSVTLWHWAAPSLKSNILKEIKFKKNNTPPRFISCSSSCKKRRSTRSVTSCVVWQLKDRHPVDTAFSLEVPVDDDTSNLTLHYSIGTHKSGQNVMGWTNMSGSIQVVPAQLPNGVPLYWTVRVKNSQGLISVAECKLDTYDNTLPDGEVQMSHEITSHPNKLSATVVVVEDSPLAPNHNISLGYSPGQYGREVSDEETFKLESTSYSTYKEYNVTLEHGARYYINAHIYNTLGYHNYLVSKGTLVDFTPPETGPIQNVIQDIIVSDGCKAAITQRCKDVTWKPNHRKVIDGPGSKTVFNGHRHLLDALYSMANNYISVNWDGFHDDESGVWGYTWAAGSEVCGSDIVAFSDPFSHLAHPKFWTYNDFADVILPDGIYYVTTQAINSVIHGGAMVTTVCHSTPITIDTSPPIFHEVSDLLFDEDFDMLAVYYNVSDSGSGIGRVDFGLGKTKYDVMVRSYTKHDFMERANPYLFIENLALQPGVQAWIRIRAFNKVDLFTASHGDEPILIDITSPISGDVLDGDQWRVDFTYQADINQICAQWMNFYDPESGISSYLWAVGTSPESDDILPFKAFPHDVKSSCSSVTLQHNTTYFSTVIAFNRGLHQKNVTTASNGVLVDITPPVPGWIHDGGDVARDMNYSSEMATKKSVWGNFSDPESDIARYSIEVFVNEEHQGHFFVGKETSFTDHSIAVKDGDIVKFQLEAENGARLKISKETDGYMIDTTPPICVDFDGIMQVMYQSDSSTLNFTWDFVDFESKMKEYRYTIYKEQDGAKQRFLPLSDKYTPVDLHTNETTKYSLQLNGLSLQNNARYFIHVTAINNALMSTVVESHGVIIDTTAPVIDNLLLSIPGEEEELDDNGKLVVHHEGEVLYVSWHAMDPESNIMQSSVCLKLKSDECSRDKDFRSVGKEMSTTIDSKMLDVTNDNQLYTVFVKVVNRAKLLTIDKSKQITVIKRNVAGVVFDGRNIYQDKQFQSDKSSIALSFTGFESAGCGISGYEWGIGTRPFYTDILSYTNYGLVVTNSSSGFAQIHNANFDGVKYFASIRAKTGHKCQNSYIVSSSDGIIVDSISPAIVFSYEDDQALENNHYCLMNSSSSGIFWNATDNVGLARYEWTLTNKLSAASNIKHINNIEDNLNINRGFVSVGDTRFLTIKAVDKAGNIAKMTSSPVTYDSTEPFVKNLICSDVVSKIKSIVNCSWDAIGDVESTIRHMSIAVGTERSFVDVLSSQNLSVMHQTWNRDIGDVLKDEMDTIFITMTLINNVHLKTQMYRRIVIDNTPPKVGTVNIITTIGHRKKYIPQRCQIPTSYIDIAVDGFQDEESGIERYEASVGKMKGGSNVKDFMNVNIVDGIGSLKNLHLVEGTTVFVTLKIYNRAGLYLMTSTEAVSISPNPHVHVTDGSMSSDQDAQNDLTVMQGYWSYSHPCPALKVEWAIEDLAHNNIKKFESIPDKGYHFYNDELSLENMKTYINVVKVVDAMNRTRLGRSNGILVQIQPPMPGFVNDGLGEDINFQHSVNTLSANWHGFGRKNSKNPSQSIVRFEVAIGNDRRYYDTRVNVLYYQNVGLNQSVTFYNLELTAKIPTYYITVRAYSETGSFQEAYSNGIKVGVSGGIEAGTIECDPVQSSTDGLEASWSGIYSDIGIREYHVGISTNLLQHFGKPFLCDQRDDTNISANVHQFVSVGLNHMHTFTGLSLHHGTSYNVLLIVHNEASICLLMESHPIFIDTSPPLAGRINIEGTIYEQVMYSNFKNELTVYLDGFQDEDSKIQFYEVALDEGQHCPQNGQIVNGKQKQIAKQRLVDDNRTVFNNILLQPYQVYYISVDAYNQAGLRTSILSKPIKIDDTSPSVGTVHHGTKWKHSIRFQNSTNLIHATLAISHEQNPHVCEDEMLLNDFQIFSNKQFTKDSIIQDSGNIHLTLHHDSCLKAIEKGAIHFKQIKLIDGNYTVNIKPTVGENILTGISYTSQDNYIPPEHFVDVLFTNATDCFESSNCVAFIKYGYNFGILIQQTNLLENYAIMWVQDKFKLQYYKIQLDSKIENKEFKCLLSNKTVLSVSSWDVIFFHDGQEAAVFNGLVFDGDIHLDIFTWNFNGYIPPVVDPFHPFKTEAVVKNVRIPKLVKPLCMYGTPFFDKESGLKEIWIGLSDSNKIANIVPFQLYASFCRQCDKSCEPDCPEVCHLPQGFIPRTFQLTNLTLDSASVYIQNNVKDNDSTAIFDNFRLPQYFVDIKVINYAGLVTYAKSDVVFVDTTPPQIDYVYCLDPTYSADEPIEFLRNNNSVSVTWDVGEDVSGIVNTFASIGTEAEINVGSNKTFTFNSLDGKLIHMHKYFANIRVENGAGLTSMKSCNFTVDVYPPDTKHADAYPLFSDLTSTTEAAVISNYTDRIGLQWKSNSIIGAKNYAWKIGSFSGGNDLFPMMTIGFTEIESVAIVDGEMILEGINQNFDLGEFVQRNFTNMSTTDHEKKKSHFKLEPGRCVYQSLYAVSRSHLESEIHVMPLCIKRTRDKLIKAEYDHTVVEVNGKLFDGPAAMRKHPDLLFDVDVDDGALSIGILHNADIQSIYGSVASTTYSPYIVDPNLTSDQLSRFLKRRIVSIMKPMFYMAPIPNVGFGKKINVTKTFDRSTIPHGTEVALLYWDNAAQLWRSVQEPCGLENIVDLNVTTFTTEVCGDVFSDASVTLVKKDSKKRSLKSPRQFMIAIIKTELDNTHPVIVTTEVNGTEDKVLKTRIKFSDADGDTLVFAIKTEPTHGTANISDEGMLYYVPEPDFNGLDELEISAAEVVNAPSVISHEISAIINISVENVDDPPALLFQNDVPTVFFQKSVNSLVNSKETELVNIELTNENTSHLVGTFWLTDIDRDDSLDYYTKFPEQSPTVNYTLALAPFLDNDVGSYGTITGQQLWMHHLPNYTGSTNVSFIVVDRDNAFSHPIIIQVNINTPTDHTPVITAVVGLSCSIVLALVLMWLFVLYMLLKKGLLKWPAFLSLKNR